MRLLRVAAFALLMSGLSANAAVAEDALIKRREPSPQARKLAHEIVYSKRTTSAFRRRVPVAPGPPNAPPAPIPAGPHPANHGWNLGIGLLEPYPCEYTLCKPHYCDPKPTHWAIIDTVCHLRHELMHGVVDPCAVMNQHYLDDRPCVHAKSAGLYDILYGPTYDHLCHATCWNGGRGDGCRPEGCYPEERRGFFARLWHRNDPKPRLATPAKPGCYGCGGAQPVFYQSPFGPRPGAPVPMGPPILEDADTDDAPEELDIEPAGPVQSALRRARPRS